MCSELKLQKSLHGYIKIDRETHPLEDAVELAECELEECELPLDECELGLELELALELALALGEFTIAPCEFELDACADFRACMCR